jgi:dTDP-4-amino-4,6-dideoxygalactose transaminase
MRETLACRGGKPVRTRPFPGLRKWDYQELREVLDVFESGVTGRYGGTKVEAFEKAFAEAYGVPHAVASTSGTAAIHVALGMLDPEPGSEVITAPITDLGTVSPILYQQCLPVFADVDPETFNLTPASIEALITERTVAILLVHLFGTPCDVGAVMAIARRHDLVVIEDCSQTHWTRLNGRLCGTIGHIGAFSLQSSKHMTTGEGGMTITADPRFGERGAFFQDKGWARAAYGPRAYRFLAPNYRMPEILGAIGLAQLRKLPDIVRRRRELGDRLTAAIRSAPGLRPQRVLPGAEHSYWQYGLTVNAAAPFTPAAFAEALRAEGVPCGAGYIGKPIFECAQCCWQRTTFGTSGLPYTLPGVRDIRYDESTCPGAREALNRMVVWGVHEAMLPEDIDDMAAAVLKVAHGLSCGA